MGAALGCACLIDADSIDPESEITRAPQPVQGIHAVLRHSQRGAIAFEGRDGVCVSHEEWSALNFGLESGAASDNLPFRSFVS